MFDTRDENYVAPRLYGSPGIGNFYSVFAHGAARSTPGASKAPETIDGMQKKWQLFPKIGKTKSGAPR